MKENPNCFIPEENNYYPLCVGKFNSNQCKNCCLYVDYEVYHSPYKEE